MEAASDVLIVGGGVIGLSIARELALAGLRTTLCDRQQPGREASWAGAGILPPALPGDPSRPLARLTAATHRLWPELALQLRESTGLDNGFRRCGGIVIRGSVAEDVPELTFRPEPRASLDLEIAAWRAAGATAKPLSAAALRAEEPELTAELDGGFRLPEVWQVRNPWHLRALIADCRRLGVQLRSDLAARRLWVERGRARGVETDSGRLAADRVVIAAGAWSRELLPTPAGLGAGLSDASGPGSGNDADIVPVRGQMVLFKLPQSPLRRVVECGNRYLVPRDDGHLLVGSTEELAGFDRQTTPAGIAGLVAFARRIVPCLRAVEPVRDWAGLRPFARAGLPYLGPAPGCEGLSLAAGHFRAGLHLSPITARLLRQSLLGTPTDLPLDPFLPSCVSDNVRP